VKGNKEGAALILIERIIKWRGEMRAQLKTKKKRGVAGWGQKEEAEFSKKAGEKESSIRQRVWKEYQGEF